MTPQPKDLPALLRDLAQHAGIAAALALAEWRGGTPLYIPYTFDEGHEIARRIGMAGARWLHTHHAGNYIKVPRAQAALRAARNAPILADLAAGMSVNAAALKYKLDARTVWTLKAAAAAAQSADTQQGKLL